MERIFISYKRADKDVVFPVKDQIEAAVGEKCWIDLEGIKSDAQFVDEIITHIDAASIVIFMYSQCHTKIQNYKTDWTIREISYAFCQNKRIIFVNIDKAPLLKWFQFMFSQHQQIDATSSEEFDRLLRDLKEWLSAPIIKNEESAPEIKTPKQIEFFTAGLSYYYTDYSLCATLKGAGEATDTDLIVPSVIYKDNMAYVVTAVEEQAFNERDNITSVVLPDSITDIGRKAFANCSRLLSVKLPSSLKYIRYRTFADCVSLSSIDIPGSVVEIEREAFEGCRSLSYIEIPEGVRKIEMNTFCMCVHLESVSVPNSILDIEAYAFYNCSSLKSINLPPSLVTIEESVFEGCHDLCSVEIPFRVKVIRKNAFRYCSSLETVTIPDSVKIIKEYAFFGCSNMHSLTFLDRLYSSRVETIPEGAFGDCTMLYHVEFPERVQEIGREAFKNCECLERITIPASMKVIREGAFENCKRLTDISISDDASFRIESRAFKDCLSLDVVNLPLRAYYNGNGDDTREDYDESFFSFPKECHVTIGATKKEQGSLSLFERIRMFFMSW